jgi:hypothetical protein
LICYKKSHFVELMRGEGCTVNLEPKQTLKKLANKNAIKPKQGGCPCYFSRKSEKKSETPFGFSKGSVWDSDPFTFTLLKHLKRNNENHYSI